MNPLDLLLQVTYEVCQTRHDRWINRWPGGYSAKDLAHEVFFYICKNENNREKICQQIHNLAYVRTAVHNAINRYGPREFSEEDRYKHHLKKRIKTFCNQTENLDTYAFNAPRRATDAYIVPSFSEEPVFYAYVTAHWAKNRTIDTVPPIIKWTCKDWEDELHYSMYLISMMDLDDLSEPRVQDGMGRYLSEYRDGIWKRLNLPYNELNR